MHDFLVAEYKNQKSVNLVYMIKANESFELTPFSIFPV